MLRVLRVIRNHYNLSWQKTKKSGNISKKESSPIGPETIASAHLSGGALCCRSQLTKAFCNRTHSISGALRAFPLNVETGSRGEGDGISNFSGPDLSDHFHVRWISATWRYFREGHLPLFSDMPLKETRVKTSFRKVSLLLWCPGYRCFYMQSSWTSTTNADDLKRHEMVMLSIF